MAGLDPATQPAFAEAKLRLRAGRRCESFGFARAGDAKASASRRQAKRSFSFAPAGRCASVRRENHFAR
jgi:hypothetical protein